MMEGEINKDRLSTDTEDEPDSISRRTAIKTTVAGIAGSTFIGQMPQVRGAESYDPAFSSTYSARVVSYDNSPDSYMAVNISITAQRVASVEIAGDAIHRFVAAACVSCEADHNVGNGWEEMKNIRNLDLKFETDQPETSSVFPPQKGDERAIAATQSSGSELDWRSGLIEATTTGVQEVSDRANVAISAYNIYNAFRNDGEEEGNGTEAEYSWGYINDPITDEPRVTAGAAARFYIEDDDPANGYGMTATTDITRYWPKQEIVSDDETENISQSITGGNVLTSSTMETSTVSIDRIDDPVVTKKAKEKGVDEVRPLYYQDSSENGSAQSDM